MILDKSTLLVRLVLAVSVANGAAGQIIMQCDVGGCGPLQSGWTGLGSCGTHTNVDGTGIDVTLATGSPGACACRNPGGTGTLANVESDLLFADNEQTSPGSDFIITFSNLAAGAGYRLLSYHNRSNEGDTVIGNVTVTGATVISKPDTILQSHATMDNPAEIIFIVGAGDVSIRYQGPAGGCPGCQAFLNGFVLEYASATAGFDSPSSGDLESMTPAVLSVVLSEAQGQTVTVEYGIAGGTAASGDDYSLVPDTLIFSPGQTGKTISIDLVNDHQDEADETIIVELSNLTGGDVQLGIAQHTYTIIDPRPDVTFAGGAGGETEDVGTADIPVTLSHDWHQTVTVNYAVSGGTATGGGVDYTLLGGGTLQFDPGSLTEYISINVIDDELEEGVETIILTLSGPANAKLGAVTDHTFTINDNEQVVLLEEFVGDSFSSFNHSSTIAETHNGVLVVAWYGGSSEGADDVSIWVSTNNGTGWTPRIEVDDGDGDATWNPVLFQPSTGPLLLYFKYTRSPGSWRGAVRKSYDDGQTWSARILLPTCSDPYLSSYGGRFTGPVKNKPLELPDGSLLCGSSTEHDGWQVHMEIARGDYTNDFELIGPLGPLEGIQPTFLVHDDSYMTIQSLCRAPGSGSPTPTTWSYDAGQTWTSLSTISRETSKGLDAVTINNLNDLKNRWHLLVYNPSGRYPLSLAVSQDGLDWDVAIPELDRDGSASMDYPSIIQTSDKMLHVVYSWRGHDKIKHVVVNPYILLDEPTCVHLPGDLDASGFVDAKDLGILADWWLSRCRPSEGFCEGADINQNFRVDLGDYAGLTGDWFQSCP